MNQRPKTTDELKRIHRHLVLRIIVTKRLMWSRWWNIRWLRRGWKVLKQTRKAERAMAAVIAQRNKIGIRCTLPLKKQRQLGLKAQLS